MAVIGILINHVGGYNKWVRACSWSAAVVHKDCLLSDVECVVGPALLLFGYLPFLVEIIYPFFFVKGLTRGELKFQFKSCLKYN